MGDQAQSDRSAQGGWSAVWDLGSEALTSSGQGVGLDLGVYPEVRWKRCVNSSHILQDSLFILIAGGKYSLEECYNLYIWSVDNVYLEFSSVRF